MHMLHWPLDDSVKESEENDARVIVPCAHGAFVHACCMLDRAGLFARRHADPRNCVGYRWA